MVSISFVITFLAVVVSATPVAPGSLRRRSEAPTRVFGVAPALEHSKRLPNTNGARFARGFPPLPPTPLPPKRLSGVRLRLPQLSSCLASENKQGRWQVRSAQSGDILGFVSAGTFDNSGLGVFPSDYTGPFGHIPSAYTKFFTYGCHNHIEPFLSSPGGLPRWFAGVIPPASSSATFGPSSSGFAFVAKSESQTVYGATPQPITITVGPASLAETAIWMFDPVTNAITAQWVNPDGNAAPTRFVVANVDGDPTLVLTGNVGYLQTVYPGSTSSGVSTQEVFITFVSI